MSKSATGADDDLARDAVLELLPFLLSNPPFIPASLKSAALNRRHQYLKVSPEEVEDYLVTDVYSGSSSDTTATTTAGRAIKLLGDLVSRIEQLAIVQSSSGGGDEVDYEAIISRVQYKSPEEGVIYAGVELGDAKQQFSGRGAPLLLLLLRAERDDTTNSTRFKYDNLQPAGQVPGPWYDTLKEAIISSSARSTFTREANAHTHHHQSQEEEENQQPSEYITNADDFWDGFDDSDKEEDSLDKSANAEKGKMEQDETTQHGNYNVQGEDHPRKAEIGTPIKDHQHVAEAESLQGRHEAIKMILGGAWKLMKGTPNEKRGNLDASRSMKEEVFMSLVREAIQECEEEGPSRGLLTGTGAM